MGKLDKILGKLETMGKLESILGNHGKPGGALGKAQELLGVAQTCANSMFHVHAKWQWLFCCARAPPQVSD